MPQLLLAVAQVLLQTQLSNLTRSSLKYRLLGEQLIERSAFGSVGEIFLADKGLDAKRLVVIVTETFYYHNPIFPESPAIVREVAIRDGSVLEAGRKGASLSENLCLHYNI